MLLTALTLPLLPQGAARAAAEATAQPPAPRWQLPPPARASSLRIEEGRAEEGGEGDKGSHAIPPARVDAVPTPAPCATVRSISPPCTFIRPICPVQATGSKRGDEGDKADMSTEDDLEVVVKKTPPIKKRCVTKFRQI